MTARSDRTCPAAGRERAALEEDGRIIPERIRDAFAFGKLREIAIKQPVGVLLAVQMFLDGVDERAKEDACFDKALEGFRMFALNQGDVCTCPSRELVQESIFDALMERATARIVAISEGNPLAVETMIGAQASKDQMNKILSCIDLGRQQGAGSLTGEHRSTLGDGLEVQNTGSSRPRHWRFAVATCVRSSRMP